MFRPTMDSLWRSGRLRMKSPNSTTSYRAVPTKKHGRGKKGDGGGSSCRDDVPPRHASTRSNSRPSTSSTDPCHADTDKNGINARVCVAKQTVNTVFAISPNGQPSRGLWQGPSRFCFVPGHLVPQLLSYTQPRRFRNKRRCQRGRRIRKGQERQRPCSYGLLIMRTVCTSNNHSRFTNMNQWI